MGAVLGSAALAQSPLPNLPPKKFMNDNVILLPVKFDPRYVDDLKEVQLYVKENPENAWTFVTNVGGVQKDSLVYKAPRDGEYWFTVVTVSKQGQPSVTNVANQPPQAIVILDREAPKVQIRSLGSVPTGHCIQVLVSDEHPDNSGTRLEYQTKDKVWRPLDTISGSFDTYCIPIQAATTGMVRVTAADRCGNKTMKEFNLQDYPADKTEGHSSPAKAAPPPPAPLACGHEGSVSTDCQFGGPMGVAGNIKSLPMPAEPVPPLMVQVPNYSPEQQPAAKAVQQVVYSIPQMKEVVNKAQFTLNYQIKDVGQSGVGKVEVWITKDMGQHWQFLTEDADRKSPVDMQLPGEGVFGLTVLASNGLGFGGEPPISGSVPDLWVEVDTTPPQAQLMSVDPLKGTQAGWVQITWQASDKNLQDDPIDLYYSPEASGPWMPIAKSVKNTGQYRWQVPHLNKGQVFIRMAASDRAGNVAISQTPQAVQLDDGTRPKVLIQGIGFNTDAVPTPTMPTPAMTTPSMMTPAPAGSFLLTPPNAK